MFRQHACPACGDTSKCLCIAQSRRIMLALSEPPEIYEATLDPEDRFPADGYAI